MPTKPPKSTLNRCAFILFVAVIVNLLPTTRSVASVPIDPGWDGTLRRLRVPVLMYHYIGIAPEDSDPIRLDLTVTPENFHKQMRWLKEKGYHTITPDDLAAALLRGARLPTRPVLLTFDDGYADAYANAFAILEEFGFTGTFFVVSDFIDERRGGFLTWDQTREMVEAGMYIQNHSRSHKDMRNRDEEWLAEQIGVAQNRIEENTGVRARFFCYPSGGYDDTTVHKLRDAGYTAAFTTGDGTFIYTDNMLRIPRVRMRGTTTIEQFAHLMAWVR